jgi:hypothetical protein
MTSSTTTTSNNGCCGSNGKTNDAQTVAVTTKNDSDLFGTYCIYLSTYVHTDI